jgi:hypothetical protein
VEKCEGDINSEMASVCGFASVVDFAAAVKTSVVHVLLALWKVCFCVPSFFFICFVALTCICFVALNPFLLFVSLP